MKKKTSILFIVGLTIIFLSVILKSLNINISNLNLAIITNIGIGVLAVAIVNILKKREGLNKDELTRKIADRSAAYSWVITFFTLFIIFWLDYFRVFIFSVSQVITILYLVMVISMLICQRIFWKKGIK